MRMISRKEKLDFDFFNLALFLISPIFSIVSIFYSLLKNTKYSIFNFSLLAGFLSSIFIPYCDYDKARYIERYDMMKKWNFDEFLIYNFSETADLIFNLILYLAGILGISIHFVFFSITSCTIYLIFFTINKYIKSNNFDISTSKLVLLFIIFAGINYADLLSGLRFYFALAFVLYGLYSGIIEKRRIAFLYLVIGAFIHFGTFLFIFVYFSYFLIDKVFKQNIYWLLIFSFIFFFLNINFILENIPYVSEGLSRKVDIYSQNDSSQEEIILTQASRIVSLANVVWVYFFYIYIFFSWRRHSNLRSLTILLFCYTNVFYSMPVFFDRFNLVVKFFAIMLLLKEVKNKFIIYLFFALLCLVNIFQINAMRDLIFRILTVDNLFLITSILKDPMIVNDCVK